MKNTISLLFVSLLASSLIIGCGSSDSNSGNSAAAKIVKVPVPGSTEDLSIEIANGNDANKPKVTPGCESGNSVPGCS